MKIGSISILRSDQRGTIFNCGNSCFISRKAGTTSADHQHPDPETAYLIQGEARLTVDDETETIRAPYQYTVGPHVYHKLVALTDIGLIVDKARETS
jgi:mannose-6-phosphate isomerase-like protein (cupin superfamily)